MAFVSTSLRCLARPTRALAPHRGATWAALQGPTRALQHHGRGFCSGPTLDTPFISDTMPIPEGIIGPVEELFLEVGQSCEENEVIAVIDTDKVALDVKASRAGVVEAILVSVGDEVKERQPLYRLKE